MKIENPKHVLMIMDQEMYHIFNALYLQMLSFSTRQLSVQPVEFILSGGKADHGQIPQYDMIVTANYRLRDVKEFTSFAESVPFAFYDGSLESIIDILERLLVENQPSDEELQAEKDAFMAKLYRRTADKPNLPSLKDLLTPDELNALVDRITQSHLPKGNLQSLDQLLQELAS